MAFQKVKYQGDIWVVKLSIGKLDTLIKHYPNYEIIIVNLSTGATLVVRVDQIKKL